MKWEIVGHALVEQFQPFRYGNVKRTATVAK